MSCCANRCRLLIEETKELKPTQGASELIEIQIMNNRGTYIHVRKEFFQKLK